VKLFVIATYFYLDAIKNFARSLSLACMKYHSNRFASCTAEKFKTRPTFSYMQFCFNNSCNLATF